MTDDSEWTKHPSVQIPEEVQKEAAWKKFEHRREIKQASRLKRRKGLWDFSSDEDEAREELSKLHSRLEANVKV